MTIFDLTDKQLLELINIVNGEYNSIISIDRDELNGIIAITTNIDGYWLYPDLDIVAEENRVFNIVEYSKAISKMMGI